MLPKKDYIYGVTKLTNDGLRTLLEDNINFEFSDFALIDTEINYDLFNYDNKITKGFDRVNFYESDKVDKINSLPVIDYPTYRIEGVQDFLFGNYVKHTLRPEEIKTESDSIRDMAGIPIERAREVEDANKYKVYEFKTEILSGNNPNYTLSDSDIISWKTAIDIRGKIVAFRQDEIKTFVEGDNIFSSLIYTVRFQGDSIDKMFQYDIEVQPNENITLSQKDVERKLGLTYPLFGTFLIYKTFILQDKEYTSEVLQIKIEKPITAPEIVQENDGKADILEEYSDYYTRKNIVINVANYNGNVSENRVYDNYIADKVLSQQRITHVATLNQPLSLDIYSSRLNNFHLELQNLSTKRTIPWINIEGQKRPDGRYITAPSVSFVVQLYKQFVGQGYYLMTRISVSPKLGYLINVDTDSNTNLQDSSVLTYSLFGEKKYKWTLSYEKAIFLGSQSQFEQMNGLQNLWYVNSSDQDLLYQPDNRRVTMDDYENFIIDVK